MILSLEETKSWLRIDGDEENEILILLSGAAEDYLKNATGREYKEPSSQAKLFCLILVADWYENRELMGSKPSEKVRFSVQSMLLQLQHTPTIKEEF
ncbi:phage gp6-like head-tail connector protein [Bacillus infantis]|uniref:Phage gp6-like head-tail connector protein n=2 Tax=Bacillus infantis TaxID=324767 RepID=A0A5D4RJF4_9BACI|nr:head-tail connector protein [Bacillus infantis]TYS50451.1 phage gp6-like head-tail connector protein [Bacillus infantis]